MTPYTPSVCAVIVTYKRRHLLARTIEAVCAQERSLDHLIVVDNASDDGTVEWVRDAHPAIEVHALDHNTGGAGGFAHGMRTAHGTGYDWVWIMDDDVAPAPDCLSRLLEVHRDTGCRVLVPRRIEVDGGDAEVPVVLDERRQTGIRTPVDEAVAVEPVDLFTFEGPLLHRTIIDAVGVPHPGHFIAGDDTLYAAAIYNAIGPQACLHVTGALIQRLLEAPEQFRLRIPLRSYVSTGGANGDVIMYDDGAFWKQAYSLRNTHLLWRRLGWKRQRAKYILAHAVRIALDLGVAVRRGRDWRRRLRWSWRAFVSGIRGNEDAFLDPQSYHGSE